MRQVGAEPSSGGRVLPMGPGEPPQHTAARPPRHRRPRPVAGASDRRAPVHPGGAGRHDPSGLPRRVDRLAQPTHHHRAPRRRGRPVERRGRRGRDVHRRRPLQGDQRPVRPRGGRPRAARGGGAHPRRRSATTTRSAGSAATSSWWSSATPPRTGSRTWRGRSPMRSAPPSTSGHRTLPLTVSLGVAIAHRDHVATELLDRADAAMYRAKRSGRAAVVHFDEEMEHELAAALAAGA